MASSNPGEVGAGPARRRQAPPTAAMVWAIPARDELAVRSQLVDVNGHMNVQHYFLTTVTTVGYWYEDIGLGQDYRNHRRRSLFTASHHLAYHAEVALGSRVSARPRLLARSDRAVHAVCYLLDETRDAVACTMEVVFVNTDLDERRAVPFDADVARWLDDAADSQPPLDWDPGAGTLLWRPRLAAS